MCSSQSRFPKLDECAHFHYDFVELGSLQFTLCDATQEYSRSMIFGEQSRGEHFSIQVASGTKTWTVKRTYANFCLLDEQLHRCIYDRKYSLLPQLGKDFDEDEATRIAMRRILTEYLDRFSLLAGNLINCGPILNWLELDNRGNHLIVTDDSAINTPAVAAAYVTKRYSAQASDEISFQVGDMISVIDMPPADESIWWRGKKGFEVGFFPCECVELIGDKIPHSIVIAKVPSKPVLRKHGKLISFFRSFILSRPSRRKLKQRGILKERVFGCDLGEHLLNSGHEIPLVLSSCAEFIEEHGIVDGIYRLSGITSNIQKLRIAFDEDRIPNLKDTAILQDIHCVASLLKMYFRELPNPLLTYQLYDKFVWAVQSGENLRLFNMRDIVQQLPPPHYRTLEYLVKHLAKVASYGAETGMTPKNVAIVWAPNLLRSKELEIGSVAALQVVGIQAIVTEFLIRYVDLIFNEKLPLFTTGGGAEGTPKKSRPKSLAISTPTKLLSLEEARTKAFNLSAQSQPKYIEVGGGPATLPIKYHTVIELVDRKQNCSKFKKSPSGWKSFFSKGWPQLQSNKEKTKSYSKISPTLLQSTSLVQPTKFAMTTETGNGSQLRSTKSAESLLASVISTLSRNEDAADTNDELTRVRFDLKNSVTGAKVFLHTHIRSISHDSYFETSAETQVDFLEPTEGTAREKDLDKNSVIGDNCENVAIDMNRIHLSYDVDVDCLVADDFIDSCHNKMVTDSESPKKQSSGLADDDLLLNLKLESTYKHQIQFKDEDDVMKNAFSLIPTVEEQFCNNEQEASSQEQDHSKDRSLGEIDEFPKMEFEKTVIVEIHAIQELEKEKNREEMTQDFSVCIPLTDASKNMNDFKYNSCPLDYEEENVHLIDKNLEFLAAPKPIKSLVGNSDLDNENIAPSCDLHCSSSIYVEDIKKSQQIPMDIVSSPIAESPMISPSDRIDSESSSATTSGDGIQATDGSGFDYKILIDEGDFNELLTERGFIADLSDVPQAKIRTGSLEKLLSSRESSTLNLDFEDCSSKVTSVLNSERTCSPNLLLKDIYSSNMVLKEETESRDILLPSNTNNVDGCINDQRTHPDDDSNRTERSPICSLSPMDESRRKFESEIGRDILHERKFKLELEKIQLEQASYAHVLETKPCPRSLPSPLDITSQHIQRKLLVQDSFQSFDLSTRAAECNEQLQCKTVLDGLKRNSEPISLTNVTSFVDCKRFSEPQLSALKTETKANIKLLMSKFESRSFGSGGKLSNSRSLELPSIETKSSSCVNVLPCTEIECLETNYNNRTFKGNEFVVNNESLFETLSKKNGAEKSLKLLIEDETMMRISLQSEASTKKIRSILDSSKENKLEVASAKESNEIENQVSTSSTVLTDRNDLARRERIEKYKEERRAQLREKIFSGSFKMDREGKREYFAKLKQKNFTPADEPKRKSNKLGLSESCHTELKESAELIRKDMRKKDDCGQESDFSSVVQNICNEFTEVVKFSKPVVSTSSFLRSVPGRRNIGTTIDCKAVGSVQTLNSAMTAEKYGLKEPLNNFPAQEGWEQSVENPDLSTDRSEPLQDPSFGVMPKISLRRECSASSDMELFSEKEKMISSPHRIRHVSSMFEKELLSGGKRKSSVTTARTRFLSQSTLGETENDTPHKKPSQYLSAV